MMRANTTQFKRHDTERVQGDTGVRRCAWVRDPTVPAPPMYGSMGPGTRYALIRSPKYVPRETPLGTINAHPPGVYIF